MTACPQPTSRDRLRNATAPQHARVDALFADGLRQARDYRVYLRGMHAFVRSLEDALAAPRLSPAWRDWRAPQRLRWLDADLSALVLAPLAPGPGLPLASDAAAAGALYVLEGSMLGARTLLGDAQALGWSAGHGAAFLSGHAGPDGGRRWRTFVGQLQGADFDDEAALLGAAAAAFASVEQEFRRAARLERESA